MNRLAKPLLLSWISLGLWAASTARAGFTITTSFDSGLTSLTTQSDSVWAYGSRTLSSYTTTVDSTESSVFDLNLANLVATAPTSGLADFSSHLTITLTITEDGTGKAGTITLDDNFSGFISNEQWPQKQYTYSFIDNLSLDKSSSLSVDLGGTTFTLADPEIYGFSATTMVGNNSTMTLPTLADILFVAPAILTVPEPSSAILAALGLGIAAIVGVRRGRRCSLRVDRAMSGD